MTNDLHRADLRKRIAEAYYRGRMKTSAFRALAPMDRVARALAAADAVCAVPGILREDEIDLG